MRENFEQLVQTARSLIDIGWPLERVLANPLIPESERERVRQVLAIEQTRILSPARVITSDPLRFDWIRNRDRSEWHYWPALRRYLMDVKGWDGPAVRSLDDTSDRILRQVPPPETDSFDTRGLVLGYVQSGKTASFTALIAKAADAGYRLFVVLSGMDKGLRRQTQIRLNKELVGYSDGRAGAVQMPPIGQQWNQFTSEDLNGDFRPGLANHGALQGTQPVLLVVKKNGAVLRRLLNWLDGSPEDVKTSLALLVIDDEADQASVDTRGSYQPAGADEEENEYVEPSVINARIRTLMSVFRRSAYIAYTATPFANILIPHDAFNQSVGNDLYPKDFIVDLPKPEGYFGAEEIFGQFDPENDRSENGLGIIKQVTDADLVSLESGRLPASLETAMIDFILGGAARARRGQATHPTTMLVHTSMRIDEQSKVKSLIENRFGEIRDEWRYQRMDGLRSAMAARWEAAFRPVTRRSHLNRDVPFSEIEHDIGTFFESVQIREINSETGDVLDYEKDPSLKAIAVGGNRLARGLTLEGLTVSYFLRQATNYDTLMQMGRWFGFRKGYEDLTRIWMTAELSSWFSDLAFVEAQLRDDIQVYESQGLTPKQLGMRIWRHPTMQVTSPLKRRFATETRISQSYASALQQTFKFPFSRPAELCAQEDANKQTVTNLIRNLGRIAAGESHNPLWSGIAAPVILDFLRNVKLNQIARSISLELIVAYIERMTDVGELSRWVVAVKGRERPDPRLGDVNWGSPLGRINQVSRSKIRETDSVGVITSPGDEAAGLDADALADMQKKINDGLKSNNAARSARSAGEGLLLLYPISRNSGYDVDQTGMRTPLFVDPNSSNARDLVGIALSFPNSKQPQHVEAYLEGTVGWRPVD